MASASVAPGHTTLRRRVGPLRDLRRSTGERRVARRRSRPSLHPTRPELAVAVARLVAYLLGVASMGVIAQGAVGSSLHNVVWTTQERTVPGEVRIVTETTTAGETTVTHTNGPGKTPPAE